MAISRLRSTADPQPPTQPEASRAAQRAGAPGAPPGPERHPPAPPQGAASHGAAPRAGPPSALGPAARRPAFRPFGPKRKAVAPPEASDELFRERARGALLGLAVGDALGVTSKGRYLLPEPFPTLNEAPVGEPRGGGAHELLPGQVGPVTHLVLAQVNALLEAQHFSLPSVARAYARWLPDALALGPTTRAALEHLAEGFPPSLSGDRTWIDAGRKNEDNEALVRTVPLVVFLSGAARADQRARAVLEDCAVTHYAPLCRLASAVYASVLAHLLSTPASPVDRKGLPQVLARALTTASDTLKTLEPDWTRQLKAATDTLAEDLELAQRAEPELYGPELHVVHHTSLVRVTLRLVLWELHHAPSYRAAVLDAVSRGGDTDVAGALTGALFGALEGERAIPSDWRDAVLEARSSARGPRRDEYHPSRLLELVGVAPVPPEADDGRG